MGDNPTNFVDPTGLWRWALTGSIYHELVESFYENDGRLSWPFLNPTKQLEYRIPARNKRVDMFNSSTGDVYEIEPWWAASYGAKQVEDYVSELNEARRKGFLKGMYLFTYPYDWNYKDARFHAGLGEPDWPGKFRMSFGGYGFPDLDLVADYLQDGRGVVVYWLEPKEWVPVGTRVRSPNDRLVRQRDWTPGQPSLQPAYVPSVWEDTCRHVAEKIILAVTIVKLLEGVPAVGPKTPIWRPLQFGF